MVYELMKSIFKRKEYYEVPRKIAATEYPVYVIVGKELPVKPRRRIYKTKIRAIRYPGSNIYFDRRSVYKFMKENIVGRPFNFFKVYRATLYPLNISTDEKVRYEYDMDKGDMCYYIKYSEMCGSAQIEYDISIEQDITYEVKIESLNNNKTN